LDQNVWEDLGRKVGLIEVHQACYLLERPDRILNDLLAQADEPLCWGVKIIESLDNQYSTVIQRAINDTHEMVLLYISSLKIIKPRILTSFLNITT